MALLSILCLLIAAILSPSAAVGSEAIPGDAFPGVDLDQPLDDNLESGRAVLLSGQVADASMADGQILFNFVSQDGGEDVQVFLDLEGTHFRGYQIFRHDQAGMYDLQVFLGGLGASSLGFVGQFDDYEISQGEGPIPRGRSGP